MMRKSRQVSKLHVRLLVAAAALLLLAGATAEAGERVKFKNGHSIVVEGVRIEGEVVYLTMSDGSEAGFPKALVEIVEEGHETKASRYVGEAKSPRSPGLTELFGYERAQRQAGHSSGMRMSGTVTRDMAGQRLTAGFRYKGSVDIADAVKSASGPKLSVADRSGRVQNVPGAKPGPKTQGGSKPSKAPAVAPRVAPNKGKRAK